MSRIYRKYLKLLEKWPVDPSKKGRDLGEYLREEVKKNFSSGINVAGDEQQCEDTYFILKRIADNHYSKLYPRKYTSCSTGLNVEDLYLALSDDFLQYLKEEEETTTSKWSKYLASRFESLKFSKPSKSN